MEFTPITTQEDFDKAIQDRLNRQKESIEKQYADYAEIKTAKEKLESEIGLLKTSLGEFKTKSETYDKDVAELNAKIAGYEIAKLRNEIALKEGIPYNLAGRLVGDDEASITEDAKKLAELVKQNNPIPPLKDPEPPIDKSEDASYKTLLQNLKLGGE